MAAERNGRWGTAIAVPGLAALNTGGYAEVFSVSCASAGNCATGGYYTAARNLNQHGFVASERNGRWAKPIALKNLNEVVSVSCASAGNCAAGGEGSGRNFNGQGFVAAERNGVWGTAIAVPGLASLAKGGGAFVDEVSCGSAGSCAAGGAYYHPGRRSHDHGWVAAERNGRWGTAIQVPGLAALNTGGRDTEALSVSCASAGNCAAGGYYYDRPDNHAHHSWFVAVERNGRWGTAIQVPGLKALNKGTYRIDLSRSGALFSVSCAPVGTCVAGGFYTDASGHRQGFVRPDSTPRGPRAGAVRRAAARDDPRRREPAASLATGRPRTATSSPQPIHRHPASS